VGDPHATSFSHQRVQRHGDTTRRGFHCNSPILIAAVEVWLPVGHDDERAMHVDIEFACLRQPAAKQNRSNEFVNGNRRNE
jgi:hypothetical protein